MFKYHIQTVQVGASGSATISFSNIPQIYDDLVLITSLRDNVASGGWENAFIYPNNSSTDMVSRFMYGWGTNNVGSGINNPAVIYHQTARGNNTANTFSNSSVTISNYSRTTFKAISAETSVERNDVAGINALTSALWSSSNPVTSLTIAAASGSFVQYSSASLYGVKRGSDGRTSPLAVGGTVTTSGGYTYHTFTSSGTFSVSSNLNAQALVVAGGGSGGGDNASGGGAGGYIAQSFAIPAGSYPVSIGAGGAMSSTTDARGYSGSNSSLLSLIAIGGGRGGNGGNTFPPEIGGSGGGGGGQSTANISGAAGTAGQGFAGGNSSTYLGGGYNGAGGGGGGASAAGGNSGGNGGVAGVGGAGSQWLNGTYYAGGGGGGANNIGSISQGAGGIGGGGTGGSSTFASSNGGNGTANTGGGGGGGGGQSGVGNGRGGAGGSGVVIIRYLTPA